MASTALSGTSLLDRIPEQVWEYQLETFAWFLAEKCNLSKDELGNCQISDRYLPPTDTHEITIRMDDAWKRTYIHRFEVGSEHLKK